MRLSGGKSDRLLEKDETELVKYADVHYDELLKIAETEGTGNTIAEVFLELFWQRFPKTSRKELDMIMLKNLPKVRNTVAGKELIEEGREEGKEEWARFILLKQLAKKFGSLPAATEEAINSMHLDAMENLSIDLLSMRDAEELETWLENWRRERKDSALPTI